MSQMDYQSNPKEECLEHYGVKGMKWGIIRSRKELGYDDAPKKRKGSASGSESGLMSKRKVRKIQKERLKAEARKRKEKQTAREKEKKEKEAAAKKAAEDEKIKEQLKTSSDPEFIYKHRHLLSTQELNERIDRINKERTIKGLIDGTDSRMKSVEDFLKRSASMAQSVASITESMKKISKKSNDKDKDDTAEKLRKEQLKQAKIKTASDKRAYEKGVEADKKAAEKEAEEARKAAEKAEKEARESFESFMRDRHNYDFSQPRSTASSDSSSSSNGRHQRSSGFSFSDAYRQARDVYDRERSTTLSTVDSWASSSSSRRAQDFIDDIVAEYDERGRRIR